MGNAAVPSQRSVDCEALASQPLRAICRRIDAIDIRGARRVKVGKFPDPIEIPVWHGETLGFSTAAKLGQWASEQRELWLTIRQAPFNQWSGPINEQHQYFQIVEDSALAYRTAADTASETELTTTHWQTLRNNINGVIAAIGDGRSLTTDTPLFAKIQRISQHNPDAAALVLMSQRSDANKQIANAMQYTHQYQAAIIYLAVSNESAEIDPANHAAEIQSLKTQLRQDSETFQKELDEWSTRYEEFSADAHQADSDRGTGWQTELTNVREDWQQLKKTYDEQLALQAPTQYWKDRENNSRTYAIVFGIAFLIVASACLGVFVNIGIPYLHNVATMRDVNVLVLALPVLIPGFIAIWLLRILGRLFAENLQLSIDAGERQTMVKTFLALMHDEQRGKALVTDNDRILILHSLFRPSAVSSADDAPPVHWFDILSQKLGGPKK